MTEHTNGTVTLTAEESAKLLKMLTYRKTYNSRPEVKAKRVKYMAERYTQQKEAMKLFRKAQTNPELAVALGMATRKEV